MGGTTRLPLAQAQKLASEVLDRLRPSCERVALAGSIRRRKPDVGDVEVIAIPYVQPPLASDLFGDTVGEPVDVLHQEVLRLIDQGVFRPRLNARGQQSVGKALTWLTYRGFAVDVYTATAATWAVTMLIRTGPAQFSHRLVTERRLGGLCPDYLTFKAPKGESSWRLRRRATGEPLDTPDEQDVFAAMGYDYLPPEQRTDQARPRLRVAGLASRP